MNFGAEEFFIVLTAQLIAVTSPGPDFAVVSRNAIVHSRMSALWTSFGISIGCLVHLAYCLLGLALLISQTPWLFQLIKLAGASYLIFIGIKSLWPSKKNSSTSAPQQQSISKLTASKAFAQGFVTNLLNPKATLYFFSVFTQVVSSGTSLEMKLIYALLIFVTTLSWFVFCSYVLTHPRLKAAIHRFQARIEKITGFALILIGVKIALP